jgi:hypothetical protein
MQLDLFCTKMHRFLDQEYATYQEDEFYRRYRDIQTELWETHIQLFFYFVTGEADFNAFYDRMAKEHKGRKIGWGDSGFIPDKISSLLYTDTHSDFKERWAKVQKLYEKCKVMEADYLKNRSNDPKSRSKRVKR